MKTALFDFFRLFVLKQFLFSVTYWFIYAHNIILIGQCFSEYGIKNTENP
jgi:hypothetical protein